MFQKTIVGPIIGMRTRLPVATMESRIGYLDTGGRFMSYDVFRWSHLISRENQVKKTLPTWLYLCIDV